MPADAKTCSSNGDTGNGSSTYNGKVITGSGTDTRCDTHSATEATKSGQARAIPLGS